MTNPVTEWTDAFGNQVAGRTNVLDVGAHYPASPDRLRVHVNGTRQFLQYDSVPEYTHAEDVHRLSPSAGDTVVLRSAERPRYVVEYELATTWVFMTNQTLSSGDSLKVGLYDGSDGWYMHQTGAHAPDEADFVLERNSSEVYRKQDVNIHVPTTDWARLRLQTAWYDITRQMWDRSYSDDGDQLNPLIGKFSADMQRGPRTGNLPVWFEITSANGDLELDAGSFAQVNLGTTTPQTRKKVFEFSYTFSTTGTWAPIYAFRVDPARQHINAQIDGLQVVEWEGSNDVNVAAQAHDPTKVQDGSGNQLTDSDFSTPVILNPLSTVVEGTTAVDAAADNSGEIVSSTANPGGYQLAWSSQRTGGSGSKAAQTKNDSNAKSGILAGDIVVIWGQADNAAEVTVEVPLEEDW